MERGEDGVGGRTDDDGREREPVHPGAVSDGVNGRTPEPSGSVADARGSTARRGAASWVNWQSALYVFVLGAASLVLAPLSGLWWIVPVLGALVPIALALLDRTAPKRGGADDKKSKERELLNALDERGEITPATAAMRTPLTVDEASKMLGDLAGKGHLKLQAEDGIMAYALPDRDRLPAAGVPPEPADAGPEAGGPPELLDDPLSERELEVLTLLASGRTNAEIAKDLFVAVGTVKSHVNNIYRKLDAANRAEAVTRAREMRLLR
jgi:DNA-binding CsgD family transcriptional regulator